MNPGGLPILTYHSIDAGDAPTSTSPVRFAETLDALREAGFRAVDLLDWIDRGRPEVEKSFALAFDDGLLSILGVADRIARDAIPATVFLLAGRIGLDNAWPGQPDGIPRARLLGWSDLEALARLGFRFGSHGVSHARLDRLAPDRAESELIRSRESIEQKIARPCRLFAYPYGASNATVRSLAARNYDAAFGTRLAYACSADDRFDIARIDGYYLRPRRAVELLISGRWHRRLAVRRVARMVRASVGSRLA
ncbi:polysaccharide deacetylase family protein [Tundrisphaera lichenicola]|uniref:polysaccharide deacetylase family protein n=1 Tax=Tundrisphaera lichenicola TaxID=2029860 RepID=UPI003EB7901C